MGCTVKCSAGRRCRRGRKDSGEKEEGALEGRGCSNCRLSAWGRRGRGPGAHRGPRAAECVHKPDAVRSGRGRSEGGGDVGPRGRRCPDFLPRHFFSGAQSSFVARFQYHNPVMGSVNGHSRRLRGGPSETKRKLGRWGAGGRGDATSKRS